MMTCTGWKGGFSVDSIAHGDGPTTFEDAMRQEFQWARSALVSASFNLYKSIVNSDAPSLGICCSCAALHRAPRGLVPPVGRGVATPHVLQVRKQHFPFFPFFLLEPHPPF